MEELDFQTDIVNSIKAQGGYALKMANKFKVGIPDLLVILPDITPCFIECKHLGEVTDDFNRAIPVTDRQRLELSRMNAGYGYLIAFVMVGLIYRKERYAVVVPPQARTLTATHMANPPRTGKRQTGKLYDVTSLIKNAYFFKANVDSRPNPWYYQRYQEINGGP